MARRRLAETGRWRKFDPSLEATFYAFFSHLVTPTLQYLFLFLMFIKLLFYKLIYGFQPAGILSGGTHVGARVQLPPLAEQLPKYPALRRVMPPQSGW